eukprot:CAMPEP_0170494500 /NCGR_PEP_ID=MMETSP0208-20121228/14675_1 /TAXON_ID=197538 /ORGANISM="Strombidium inclinatum, Strain S3" /LENGTH=362 /DNA_ID=CAMNT_0010770563 /DNA_START=15 /DNA_END=1103 /DNA_ORIENTATION=+
MKEDGTTYIYSTDQLLGKGAFGNVFVGYKREEPQTKLAVKVVNLDRLFAKCEEKGPEILIREVNIMKELKHKNILNLLDSFSTNDNCYLITELCNGSLDQLISRKAPFEEEVVQDFVHQICKAMAYLSEREIMHRDIKPPNILYDVSPDSVVTVKLADFGLAKVAHQTHLELGTGEHTVCGTGSYQAPEVVCGTYNLKADIWSLGVMFLEMIAPAAPWRVKKDISLKRIYFKNFACGRISKESLGSSGISEELYSLLRRMVCVSQKERINWSELSEHPFVKLTPEQFAGRKQTLVNEDSKKIEEAKVFEYESHECNQSLKTDEPKGPAKAEEEDPLRQEQVPNSPGVKSSNPSETGRDEVSP